MALSGKELEEAEKNEKELQARNVRRHYDIHSLQLYVWSLYIFERWINILQDDIALAVCMTVILFTTVLVVFVKVCSVQHPSQTIQLNWQ